MVPGKTILLVEDDPDLLEFAEELLQKFGYRVFKADNAESAFQVIDAEHIHLDLLLSDIRLPGSVNGVDLAKHAVSLRPTLKVLLTSGYDEYFINQTVQGHFSFIEKPYFPAKLDQAIREVIGISG